MKKIQQCKHEPGRSAKNNAFPSTFSLHPKRKENGPEFKASEKRIAFRKEKIFEEEKTHQEKHTATIATTAKITRKKLTGPDWLFLTRGRCKVHADLGPFKPLAPDRKKNSRAAAHFTLSQPSAVSKSAYEKPGPLWPMCQSCYLLVSSWTSLKVDQRNKQVLVTSTRRKV